MDDVALLSNYKTRNLGNLALTRVVQRLLASRYGADHLLALHRLPHPIADVVTGSPLSGWQRSLERTVGDLGSLPRPDRSTFGEREPDLAAIGKEGGTPSGARALLGRAAHSGPGVRVRARLDRDTGREHLGGLAGVSDVVWNPGGEINVHATPSSRLLDIDFAIARSKRVALTNFSFEPTAETLAFFTARAPSFHRVIARDERTAAALVDLGVDPADMFLSPDAVFLAGSETVPELAPTTTRTRRAVLGVVLHGITSVDASHFARVIGAARDAGLAIEILSSHLTIDGEVIDQVLAVAGDAGVTVMPEFTDIPAYLSHLSGLHAVVTARFHTAVMGLLAGTTVVGVDTYGTKVAGGLTTAGFADALAAGADWPEQAIEIIERGEPAERSRIDDARARVLATWSEVFPMADRTS